MAADDLFARMNTTAPVAEDALMDLFGTNRPTAEQVTSVLLASGRDKAVETGQLEKQELFWAEIGRGQSRYIVTYRDDEPAELFIAGYSFD